LIDVESVVFQSIVECVIFVLSCDVRLMNQLLLGCSTHQLQLPATALTSVSLLPAFCKCRQEQYTCTVEASLVALLSGLIC
jgi:hypothetical protein